jgi:hypothetical protein
MNRALAAKIVPFLLESHIPLIEFHPSGESIPEPLG